jgi:hypothetical protein
MHYGDQTSDVYAPGDQRACHVTLCLPASQGAQPDLTVAVMPAGGAWALIDRRPLRIRPIDVDDRARLAGLFGRMSPESRLRRYLTPKPRLSSTELSYLTDVDHFAHEALVVSSGRPQMASSALRRRRCGRTGRPGRCCGDSASKLARARGPRSVWSSRSRRRRAERESCSPRLPGGAGRNATTDRRC